MKPGAIQELRKPMPQKNRAINRALSRVSARIGVVGRAPGKTGQPEWFVEMQESFRLKRAVIKEQRRQKRYLDQIPVENLIEYAKQPEALIAAIAPVYSTVWRLSQGNAKTLAALPGVKPGALRKLRQALVVKGVTVLWGAP